MHVLLVSVFRGFTEVFNTGRSPCRQNLTSIEKKKTKIYLHFYFCCYIFASTFFELPKKDLASKSATKKTKNIRRHPTTTGAPLLKSKRITKQRTVQTQDEQHCCGLRRMCTLAPVCVRRTILVLSHGIALPQASLAPAFAQRSKCETRCTLLNSSRAQRGMLRRLGF